MCVLKKTILTVLLMLGVFECQAQLELFVLDSSFQTYD